MKEGEKNKRDKSQDGGGGAIFATIMRKDSGEKITWRANLRTGSIIYCRSLLAKCFVILYFVCVALE